MYSNQTVAVGSLDLYQFIVKPAFTDLVGTPGSMPMDGWLNDFTVMDYVPRRRPIIDVRPAYNILKNRSASCDLEYSKIMSFGVRQIETHDLYGAVEQCKREFYQGDLRDFEAQDQETFGGKILPFFQNAIRIDLATNVWFGDMERTKTGTQQFATTNVDGVFKWLATYTTDGTIPATQTVTAPVANLRSGTGPLLAYQLLQSLVAAQSELLRAMPDETKRIYVDKAILDGYRIYVRSLGNPPETVRLYNNGAVELTAIDNIAIIPVAIWAPVLADLNGDSLHHAAILTIDKNFVFATDNTYGEGPQNTALNVWYNYPQLSWMYQLFLRAGTQISVPELVVYAI